MPTAGIAALAALMTLAFVESMARTYPSKRTWRRMRARYGYGPLRAMRERFALAAERRTGRRMLVALLLLMALWVAVARWLHKEWYEVLLDLLPYAIAAVTLLRVPPALAAVARRMKDHERGEGYDPDADLGDPGEGPEALAL